MISYYIKGWKQSFRFKGRATRKEFWWFVFWDIIFLYALFILYRIGKILSNHVLSIEESIPPAIFLTESFDLLYPILLLTFIVYFFAGMMPRIAIAVRRLHDTCRSALWIFLHLIPVVNLIIIFWYAQPSKDSPMLRFNDFNLK